MIVHKILDTVHGQVNEAMINAYLKVTKQFFSA